MQLRKYESKIEGDRWWPITLSSTIDGRLVRWMEENGATEVTATMSDGSRFEVRAVGSAAPLAEVRDEVRWNSAAISRPAESVEVRPCRSCGHATTFGPLCQLCRHDLVAVLERYAHPAPRNDGLRVMLEGEPQTDGKSIWFDKGDHDRG